MRLASIAAHTILGAAIAFSGAAAAQTAKTQLTPSNVRPPADFLVDCAKAGKDAVTRLPADLATWATIYCTKNGHLFNANENYFGVFPDTGLRATIGAGEIDGKVGEAGAGSYFKAITYTQLSDADIQQIIKVDPVSAKIIQGRPVKRLDLTTNGGMMVSYAVIDPSVEPFWVFPLTDKGLVNPAFFVASLATANRAR